MSTLCNFLQFTNRTCKGVALITTFFIILCSASNMMMCMWITKATLEEVLAIIVKRKLLLKNF